MRRHLNTLYVTSQGAWLNKDGLNIVVSVEGEERGPPPVHGLGSLVCFGRVAMSPQVMGFCADEGVSIAFMSEQGRFLARVEGPVSGNVLLRREQYRRSDDAPACATLVRSIVIGKALNQRAVIRRGLRDHREAMGAAAAAALEAAEARLTDIARRAERPAGRGCAARPRGRGGAYIRDFRPPDRGTEGRVPLRGALTPAARRPINALLSFVYSLLTHDARSALETVGL